MILTTLPVRVSAAARQGEKYEEEKRSYADCHSFIPGILDLKTSQIAVYLISRSEGGLLWLAGADSRRSWKSPAIFTCRCNNFVLLRGYALHALDSCG